MDSNAPIQMQTVHTYRTQATYIIQHTRNSAIHTRTCTHTQTHTHTHTHTHKFTSSGGHKLIPQAVEPVSGDYPMVESGLVFCVEDVCLIR